MWLMDIQNFSFPCWAHFRIPLSAEAVFFGEHWNPIALHTIFQKSFPIPPFPFSTTYFQAPSSPHLKPSFTPWINGNTSRLKKRQIIEKIESALIKNGVIQ